MKTLIIVLVAILFSKFAIAQTTGNVRFVFRTTKSVEMTRFGISAYVVLPNITTIPSKVLTVMGPRYNGNGWFLEMMPGFFTQNKKLTPLVSFRSGTTLLGISSFSIIEWSGFNPKGTQESYVYQELLYPFLGEMLFIGIESENSFFNKPTKALCVGPSTKIPFKSVAVMASYQIHRYTNNQF